MISIEIPVAWGDMDAFAHVNNTVYLRWFESARIAFFEQVQVSMRSTSTAGSPSCTARRSPTRVFSCATRGTPRCPVTSGSVFGSRNGLIAT